MRKKTVGLFLVLFVCRLQAVMVAQWDFENNFLDTTGNGNHLGNTATFSFADGISGQAAVFDGNWFLYSADTDLTQSRGSFSVGAWIKTDQAQALDAVVIGNFFTTSYGMTYNGITYDRTAIYGYVREGGNHVVQASAGLADNQWHHLAQTFDGTTMKLYIDGAEVDSATSSYSTTSTDVYEFSIGGRSIKDNMFVGSIDEAFLADHAMNATEIQTLAAVPEPASIAMLGLVVSVGVFIRRRFLS